MVPASAVRVATVLAVALTVGACWAASALAALPDGRVYEQVTPMDKGGAMFGMGSLNPAIVNFYVAPGDGTLTYGTFATTLPDLPGAPNQSLTLLQTYGFQRASDGTWSYVPLLPPNPLTGMSTLAANTNGGFVTSVAPDLSASLALSYYGMTPAVFNAEAQQPNLVLSTSAGVRTVLTPEYSPAASTYISGTYLGPTPVGNSTSPWYSHVLYEANGGFALAADETQPIPTNVLNGTDNGLYDYTNGGVHPVAMQPDGTPFATGVGSATASIGLSADGSKIVFPASSGNGTAPSNQLFLRTGSGGGSPATVPLSVTTPTTTAAAPGWDANCHLDTNTGAAPSTAAATFAGTNADASLVLFTSKCELVQGSSNTGGSDAYSDLYVYNTTGSPLDGVAAGQTVDLTPDAVDANGADVQQVLGESTDGSYVYFTAHGSLAAGATNTHLNLYVWHSGTTTYLGDLSSTTPSTALVSPDGSHLLIRSTAQLTAFNNNAKAEAYEYAATGGGAICVSCVPGVTPTGAVSLTTTSLAANGTEVFFQTNDALTSADQNTTSDVYEWTGGSVYLISGGTATSNGSVLIGASADGNDVYFATTDKLQSPTMTTLAPTAGDSQQDLFDARVGGISPSAPATSFSPPCSTGSSWTCQPGQTAPPALTAPNGIAGSNVTSVITRGGPAGPATSVVSVKVAAVTARALRRAVRSGRLSIDLLVPRKVTAAIKGTIRAGRGKHRHSVVVGRSRSKLAAGHRTRVTLHFSERLKRLLRHGGRRVSVTITVTAPHVRTKRFTVVLRGRR